MFVNSEMAEAVWMIMEERLQIHSTATCISLKLNDWWLFHSRSPCHKALLSIVSTSTCWELWLNTNKGRFDNKRQLLPQIMANINSNINAIIGGHKILNKMRVADD